MSIFKTVDDFGGYWLKGIRNFKGHDQEPLFQGNIYFNNKKIGFFSLNYHGEPPNVDVPDKQQQSALFAFATKHTGKALKSTGSVI